MLYTGFMRSGKSDTSPDVEEILVAGYRRMTPGQRLDRVADLNRALRELALAGIRQRYGAGLTAEEEKLRLAALSIDRETMIRAFGWDPDEHGL